MKGAAAFDEAFAPDGDQHMPQNKQQPRQAAAEAAAEAETEAGTATGTLPESPATWNYTSMPLCKLHVT